MRGLGSKIHHAFDSEPHKPASAILDPGSYQQNDTTTRKIYSSNQLINAYSLKTINKTADINQSHMCDRPSRRNVAISQYNSHMLIDTKTEHRRIVDQV